MYHPTKTIGSGTKPGYPRSELLALLPTINPFITPVFPASDHLDPLREIDTYPPEMITQTRILSESQGLGRWFERLRESFRQRTH